MHVSISLSSCKCENVCLNMRMYALTSVSVYTIACMALPRASIWLSVCTCTCMFLSVCLSVIPVGHPKVQPRSLSERVI